MSDHRNRDQEQRDNEPGKKENGVEELSVEDLVGIEQDSNEDSLISDDLPVLPLRGIVVYPMMWLPLTIGQERSIQLVEDALPQSRIIALVTSRDESLEEPSPAEIYEIGTAAQVHRVLKAPDGTIRLALQGLERIRLTEYIQQKPYLRARVEVLP